MAKAWGFRAEYVMKKIKVILSVMMVLALALSVATVAMADPTMSITVKNAYPGQQYKLYKIFDATVTDARAAATDANESTSVSTPGITYTLPTGKSLSTTYTYTDSAGTSHTVQGSDWFTTNAAGTISAASGVDETDIGSEDFREWAKQFGSLVDTQSNSGSTAADVVFSGLTEDGYYFITTSVGTLITVTSIAPSAIVKDKNTPPTLTKVVSGGTVVGGTTAAVDQEQNTASIGTELTFKATVGVKANAVSYVFSDALDAGLTLVPYDEANSKDVSVVVGSTDLTKAADGVTHPDYTLTTFNTTTGNIVITFTQEFLDGIDSDTDIVIMYKALVNENATIDDESTVEKEGNNNVATLSYGTQATQLTDSTSTYVYQFGLYKTANVNNVDHTIIPDAHFRLYGSANGDDEIAVVKDASTNTYRPALSGETGVDIVAGEAVIYGLQNGTYYLAEVAAPEGYNPILAREPVTITDENNMGTVTSGVYQYVADPTFVDDPDDTDDVADQIPSGGVEVINVSGTLLPETGGFGTKFIYIAGAAFIVGSILLFSSNKSKKETYGK